MRTISRFSTYIIAALMMLLTTKASASTHTDRIYDALSEVTPEGQGINWKKIGEGTLFVLFTVGFLGAMGWVEEQDEKEGWKKPVKPVAAFAGNNAPVHQSDSHAQPVDPKHRKEVENQLKKAQEAQEKEAKVRLKKEAERAEKERKQREKALAEKAEKEAERAEKERKQREKALAEKAEKERKQREKERKAQEEKERKRLQEQQREQEEQHRKQEEQRRKDAEARERTKKKDRQRRREEAERKRREEYLQSMLYDQYYRHI